MQEAKWIKDPADVARLRELGKRIAEIAHGPDMEALRENWRRHNDLREARPLVIVEAELVRNEGVFDAELRCVERWARRQELNLLYKLYSWEHIKQDLVIDAEVRVNWEFGASTWGVEVKRERGTDAEGRQLGYHWEPPIKDIRKDLGLLKPREFSVNRENPLEWKAFLEEVYDGVLAVDLRGSLWWTMGLTQDAINLVGLENFMLYMVDEPELLHRLMRIITDGTIAMGEYCEKEGLLTLNNGNDYIGSGTYGWTRGLPAPDWKPGMPVRQKDMWVLVESQETVGVSPAMYAEFVLPYHKEIAERWGRVYYGCCEPVHDRWKYVRTLPNLRSVSISPWCDQRKMAEALGRDYVFSRKPNPSLLSHGSMDEDALRADLTETCRAARGLPLEIIMKDLHTVNHEPERITTWVRIAKECVEKEYFK